MFWALRRCMAALALGVCISLPAQAATASLGTIANTQARYIATYFPGRITGTPAEMLSADYIRQQFTQMGYQSDIRTFSSRYIYTTKDNRQNWHNVTGSTVIAAHEGKSSQIVPSIFKELSESACSCASDDKTSTFASSAAARTERMILP